MANDVVFKTKAFGGFNKDEVMDFVNKILAEKSELEKKLSESYDENDKIKGELQMCKDAQTELEAAKNEINSLKSELEEKLSVEEVSIALGFSSASYFSSAFKKKFGKSPRDYRKKT